MASPRLIRTVMPLAASESLSRFVLACKLFAKFEGNFTYRSNVKCPGGRKTTFPQEVSRLARLCRHLLDNILTIYLHSINILLIFGLYTGNRQGDTGCFNLYLPWAFLSAASRGTGPLRGLLFKLTRISIKQSPAPKRKCWVQAENT